MTVNKVYYLSAALRSTTGDCLLHCMMRAAATGWRRSNDERLSHLIELNEMHRGWMLPLRGVGPTETNRWFRVSVAELVV